MTRRRRANSTQGKRSIVHRVFVNQEEEIMLRRLADEQNITVARLLIESARAQTNGERRVFTIDQLNGVAAAVKAARMDLARIGVNVNQIARQANMSQGIDTKRFDQVREDLRRPLDLIERTLDEFVGDRRPDTTV